MMDIPGRIVDRTEPTIPNQGFRWWFKAYPIEWNNSHFEPIEDER